MHGVHYIDFQGVEVIGSAPGFEGDLKVPRKKTQEFSREGVLC